MKILEISLYYAAFNQHIDIYTYVRKIFIRGIGTLEIRSMIIQSISIVITPGTRTLSTGLDMKNRVQIPTFHFGTFLSNTF